MDELRKSKKWVPGYLEVEQIRKEAIKIGEERGIEKKAKDTAKRMLKDGLPIDTISKYTGLTEDEVKKLQKSKKVN